MFGWMDGCMDVWMYVCMDGWMMMDDIHVYFSAVVLALLLYEVFLPN
jgi:hypothetical protein